jgi:hypothetical protein
MYKGVVDEIRMIRAVDKCVITLIEEIDLAPYMRNQGEKVGRHETFVHHHRK